MNRSAEWMTMSEQLQSEPQQARAQSMAPAESPPAPPSSSTNDVAAAEFARLAGTKHPGLIVEFTAFLLYSKKWYLMPIVVLLLLAGLLIVLTASPLAPFIYPFI